MRFKYPYHSGYIGTFTWVLGITLELLSFHQFSTDFAEIFCAVKWMRKLNFILQDYSSKCNVRMRARARSWRIWMSCIFRLNEYTPLKIFTHTLCILIYNFCKNSFSLSRILRFARARIILARVYICILQTIITQKLVLGSFWKFVCSN